MDREREVDQARPERREPKLGRSAHRAEKWEKVKMRSCFTPRRSLAAARHGSAAIEQRRQSSSASAVCAAR